MRTIGDLSRVNARRYPDKIALIWGEQTLSYAELDRDSNRLANALAAAGVAPGDRVALLSYNRIEYAVATQAVAKAGAILVPVNFRLQRAELNHILADSGPKLILAEASFTAAIRDVAPDLPIVTLDNIAAEGAETLGALTADASAGHPDILVDEKSPCVIMYTSGTTGRPKGVLVPHETYFRMYLATSIEAGLAHDDVYLLAVPMFHAAGMNLALHQCLFMGSTGIVHAGSFDAGLILGLIARHRISVAVLIPTTVAMLADHPDAAVVDVSSLRRIFYGAMSISPELLAQARALFPAVGFVQLYGSTETGMAAVLRPEDHGGTRHVTGREALLSEIRIVDAQGNDVPVGGEGEVITLQAALGMTGYWNNPAATAETIRNGWIHSGDIARRDEDGLFLIIDRMKDTIISGGENIYPKEIEAVLITHPAVRDVAVFGVPDRVYGETVAAAVVFGDNAPVALEELVEFGRGQLAGYKLPRHLDIYEALPRNSSDKVQKNMLREAFAARRREAGE